MDRGDGTELMRWPQGLWHLLLAGVLIAGCTSGERPANTSPSSPTLASTAEAEATEPCSTGTDQARSAGLGGSIGAVLGGGFAKLMDKNPWVGAAIGGAAGGGAGYMVSKSEECPSAEEIEAEQATKNAPRPLFKNAEAER